MSGEDLQGFADRLLQAVASQSLPDANACVDWSAMVDTAVNGLIKDRKTASEFAKGANQGIRGSQDTQLGFMGQVIAQTTPAGGSYRLLRFHAVDGKPHALFRLVAGGGLNYHDYELEKRGGEVVATDIYIYAVGERLTRTLRRGLLPAAQQLSKSWFGKLLSSDQALLDNYQLFAQMNVLASQQKGQAALDVYDQLPTELQQMKLALTVRYQAASLVGDEAVLAAIDDFEKAHPGDPALLLIALDGLIFRKQYDKALANIDQLDEAVGGDGHLNLFRTNIELMRGDNAAALRHCRALVESLPGELQYRWSLVELLLRAEDHAGVYRALSDMDASFQMEWNDLREQPAYAGFVASPEGQSWLREKGFLEGEAAAAAPAATREAPTSGLLTWTDKTGNFSVEADFVEVDTHAKKVKLRKADGKVIAVPIGRLSPESREQAKQLFTQQKAAAGS